MGQKLFGVDISGLVHANLSPGLPTGQLRSYSETQPGPRLIDGPVPAYADPVDFRGFWDSWTEEDYGRYSIQASDKKLTIIGDSLPGGQLPKYRDQVTLAGETKMVQKIVDMDPAKATITVQCRDRAGPADA